MCIRDRVYSLTISEKKTKTMSFKDKNPVKTKIVINNSILELVSRFKYLGFEVSDESESDIKDNINKFKNICRTINGNLRDKARDSTKLNFISQWKCSFFEITVHLSLIHI